MSAPAQGVKDSNSQGCLSATPLHWQQMIERQAPVALAQHGQARPRDSLNRSQSCQSEGARVMRPPWGRSGEIFTGVSTVRLQSPALADGFNGGLMKSRMSVADQMAQL